MFNLVLPLHLHIINVLLKHCTYTVNFKLWCFAFQKFDFKPRIFNQIGYFPTRRNDRISSKRPVCAKESFENRTLVVSGLDQNAVIIRWLIIISHLVIKPTNAVHLLNFVEKFKVIWLVGHFVLRRSASSLCTKLFLLLSLEQGAWLQIKIWSVEAISTFLRLRYH